MAEGPEQEALAVARRSADRAPSIAGTRPWIIGGDSTHITLSADSDRQLEIADPTARELIMSCGAALFTIRVALQAQGFRPQVRLLPDPDRPGLLAAVTADGTAEPDPDAVRLFEAVDSRRTHRGAFAEPVSDPTRIRRLQDAAESEHASLQLVTGVDRVRSLASLVAAAEFLHRSELPVVEEQDRWVRAAGDPRPGGVHAEDFPPVADDEAVLFPGRDFGHGRIGGRRAVGGSATGAVALLTTVADDRSGHLAAGQALQRIALTAESCGLRSAYHSQPLEEPLLRALITERFAASGHPQMILRLGRPARTSQDGSDGEPDGVAGLA
ncbi:Acg family FMN-binding oxidoreductase [Nocardiopsis coralliicola]